MKMILKFLTKDWFKKLIFKAVHHQHPDCGSTNMGFHRIDVSRNIFSVSKTLRNIKNKLFHHTERSKFLIIQK